MEDAPGNGAKTLAFVSKGLNTAGGHSVVSAGDYESPGFTISCQPWANKRKFASLEQPINTVPRSSLVLELGLTSKYCTTGKEIDEVPSVDIGLGTNLGLLPHPKNRVVQSSKALETPFSNIDLQLSLSTGPADSVLTCATHDSNPPQKLSDSPALAHRLQLFDEWSTSSSSRIGSHLPPLNISSSTDVEPYSAGDTSPLTNRRKSKAKAKTCMVEGCATGARGASGLCIAHGGGRRCQRAGCYKGAEGKTVFCKAHGGGRRCQHLGCTKSAEGRTDFCIAHGGGRRCAHDGCSRASRGKSGLCIRHGGGKRCKVEDCKRSAEGHSGLCISHGGGRRCQHIDCTKGAQGSTMLCKAHGGGRRCTYLGCTKGAEGSTLFCKGHGGGKRCTSEGCTKSVHGGTHFCVGHGGGKRCAEPGCTKSARGRTSHCVRHGGGKRCRFEGCAKSAQGSTDFCKAHGGGRRCTWGQFGSVFVGGGLPCEKFARGKSGLCVAHGAQVKEKAVNERTEMVSSIHGSDSSFFMGTFAAGTTTVSSYRGTTSLSGSMGYGGQFMVPQENGLFRNAASLDPLSLPEGRVHGGSLMSMLRKGVEERRGTSSSGHEASGRYK